MKKRLVMTIAIASVVVLSGLACAETVTRIAGNRITVRDSKGNERTIEGTSKGLKVGDRVRLMSRGGRTWLDPQPEPPSPREIKPANQKPSALNKKLQVTPEAPPPPSPPDKLKLK